MAKVEPFLTVREYGKVAFLPVVEQDSGDSQQDRDDEERPSDPVVP
jgi:hypothetical protein